MVVALSAMGLVTILFGFVMRKQGSDARNWPVVSGRIDRSAVDEFRGRLSNDSAVTTLYRPLISFAYEFNGVTYVGSQVSLGLKVTSSSAAFANKTVAKYPVGKLISVHVNPQNPVGVERSRRHRPRRRMVHLGDRRGTPGAGVLHLAAGVSSYSLPPARRSGLLPSLPLASAEARRAKADASGGEGKGEGGDYGYGPDRFPTV